MPTRLPRLLVANHTQPFQMLKTKIRGPRRRKRASIHRGFLRFARNGAARQLAGVRPPRCRRQADGRAFSSHLSRSRARATRRRATAKSPTRRFGANARPRRLSTENIWLSISPGHRSMPACRGSSRNTSRPPDAGQAGVRGSTLRPKARTSRPTLREESEPVLPLAQFGKDGARIGTGHADCLLHLRIAGAQKWVRRLFLGKRGRHGELVGGTLFLDLRVSGF